MRTQGLIVSLCCASLLTLRGAADPAPLPAAKSPLAATARADAGRGIAWKTSLAAAKAKARQTGKPLFLLHMFGKLSEPFC